MYENFYVAVVCILAELITPCRSSDENVDPNLVAPTAVKTHLFPCRLEIDLQDKGRRLADTDSVYRDSLIVYRDEEMFLHREGLQTRDV